DVAPIVPVLLGELGDRRGLAAAVDTDDEDDKWLLRQVETQWFRNRLDEPDYFVGERGADFFRRDLLVEAGLAQCLGDFAGHAHPHVARNQQLLELEQRLVIEAAAGENRIDALGETRRTARHPGLEPAEPAPAFLDNLGSRLRFPHINQRI